MRGVHRLPVNRCFFNAKGEMCNQFIKNLNAITMHSRRLQADA